LTKADNDMFLSGRDVILQEHEDWNAVVHHVLGPNAELVSVSRYVCDSRVYRTGGHTAKIRRLMQGSGADTELRGEVTALERLGRVASYDTWGEWEYSVQEEMPGRPFGTYLFDQQESSFGTRARLRVIRNLLPELRKLHRHGISHGDLNPDNLLIEGNRVTLIDFDRAYLGSRLRATLRDWVGVGRGLQRRTPIWKLALFTLFPKSKSIARRVRWKLARPHAELPQSADAPDVAALQVAWHLAESSPANSPGQGIAYYALSYRGAHFPGERAWQLRWDAIARVVDFSGKSLLELGCNMGLLSTFARLAGARHVLGVDYEPQIVEAAQQVAKALGIDARFEQLDLTDEGDWETQLGGRDIVTALSVVHWLPNRDRVLRFLARHRELLYEGHDTLDVETERLRALGFDSVEVVMTTERDRHLLYARQSAEA
jgi:hypothetical protein